MAGSSTKHKQGTIELAGTSVGFTLRRSRRARRLLLKVDQANRIELIIPYWVSYRAAEKFLHSRHDWLTTTLRRRKEIIPHQPRALIDGAILPYLGTTLTLSVTIQRGRSRVKHSHGHVTIQVATERATAGVVERWYREQARAFFTATTHTLAQQLGVGVARVRIGNQKTQWGSASPRKTLSFNWRLMLGPEAIARYVAAHEVAHLRHRNHSATFWHTVAQLDPEYLEHKTWLRQYGKTLYL